MQLYRLILSICLLDWAAGQIVYYGKCPDLKPVDNFDLQKYEGTWYEYMKNRRYYIITDSGLRCAMETYVLQEDGTYEVTNKGIHVLGGRHYETSGTARQTVSSTGKFEFDFPGLPASPHNIPYTVLETDYDNYSVVMSCSTAGRFNTQIVWILTRDRNPDDETVKKATAVVRRGGFPNHTFIRTNQKNCPEINKKKKGKQ